MGYRKEFITRLKPNASTKRYPDTDNLTNQLDGFYIHNRSAYTIYVNYDVEATGKDSDIPIAAGDWRDFGVMVDRFVSAYCASDASATDADIVLMGYKHTPEPLTITLKKPEPPKQKRSDADYGPSKVPEYLRRGDHVDH